MILSLLLAKVFILMQCTAGDLPRIQSNGINKCIFSAPMYLKF